MTAEGTKGGGDAFLLFHQAAVACFAHKPRAPCKLRQAQVRIILPEEKAVFRTGCHHAVGFVGALGGKIIHQHADVGIRP